MLFAVQEVLYWFCVIHFYLQYKIIRTIVTQSFFSIVISQVGYINNTVISESAPQMQLCS